MSKKIAEVKVVKSLKRYATEAELRSALKYYSARQAQLDRALVNAYNTTLDKLLKLAQEKVSMKSDHAHFKKVADIKKHISFRETQTDMCFEYKLNPDTNILSISYVGQAQELKQKEQASKATVEANIE